MQGKLIVFEGGEGSGKTTQIQRLFEWLNKSKALETLRTKDMFAGIQLTREPGGSALGQQIRQLLLSDRPPTQAPIADTAELLLYAADRAQHVEETLVPWLKQGYWVLCDRYTDSTVAYQGYGRQLDLALIHQLNQIATGGLKSDLTLWLNVAPAIGLARMQQRGQADRIEQASGEFHQRVSEGFAALAAGQVSGDLEAELDDPSSGPTVEINGDRPIEAVANDIQHILQQRIAQWYPSLSQI
jgi:dTMP kinase